MKNKRNLLVNIMYMIFIIGTITTMVIVYKDIKGLAAIRLVIGYVIFLILFVIYFIFSTVLNMKKLKVAQLRKKLFKFIAIFIVFWAIDVLILYIIKGQVNIIDKMFVPLGCAFGITFWDSLYNIDSKKE